MRHEPVSIGDLHALSAALRKHGARHDEDGSFPAENFDLLRSHGAARPPIGAGDMLVLLALLAAVGRGDLSTGRIFEGHVNACWLVETYGTPRQRADLARLLGAGSLLGVWNTDEPGDPLRMEGGRLLGRKNFASGVDGLSHAIVTIAEPAGRRMLLVPLAGLAVDRSWWRPLGMRSSGSHVVDLTGLEPQDDWFVGEPDDYIAQPWFSAGAVRFLAVQVGGMHAVLDTATSHLAAARRAENPYQAHRVARMAAAVETGYLWIERAGRDWIAAQARPTPHAAGRLAAGVNGARLAVEAAAMTVLAEAEQAIGAAGMIAPHPFERQMRDLRTYLRQPNPDGAAAAFGASAAQGNWWPGEGLPGAVR